MTKKIIAVAAMLVIASAFEAHAQENVDKKARGKLRKESKKELRVTTTTQREGVKEKIREEVKRGREAFRQDLEAKKEEAKKQVEAKRAELKEKLEKIKNEKKKEAVTRIENQFGEINQRIVTHFGNVLDKLAEILEKIEGRGADAAAVQNARTEIEKARAAAQEQARKTYSVSDVIRGEGTLKQDIGALRKSLGDDLTKVREAIKTARNAVQQVARALRGEKRQSGTSTNAGIATTTVETSQ